MKIHRKIRVPGGHIRALLKAITWRILGSADTFMVAWIATGRPFAACSIAGFEVATKVFWFYAHERVWKMVPERDVEFAV